MPEFEMTTLNLHYTTITNYDDIYKNVNVVAKRARQINDSRYDKVLSMQNIEDTDQLDDINEERVNILFY